MQRMTAQDTPRYQHPPASQEEGPGYQPRTLVLLGASLAHVHLLKTLAAQPLIGVQVVLVAPHPHYLHAPEVADFAAGHIPLSDCLIPLEPLVRQGGVRWLQRNVKAVDARTQVLQLDDASTLHYDWLSVGTDPLQNRDDINSSIPGARDNGLFLRPAEAFVALWPQVVAMGESRALRVAVIGAQAAGIALALAVRHRLPTAAVTLISGAHPPGARTPARVQAALLNALKQRQVTVLQDTAIGVNAGEVRLACGAGLACDVPLIATGAHPPSWLGASGLALDDQGHLAVDACLRSTSHAQVFFTAQGGPALTRTLRQAATGQPVQAAPPGVSRLQFFPCGERYAIACWGGVVVQGRWVWWLKRWRERTLLARYTRRA